MCFELYLVKKGGNKKGFLQSEKRLDKGSMDELKQAFANLYSNSSDNVVILNNGIRFQESSNTSVEMQLNENKQSNAEEFAKIFHISTCLLYTSYRSPRKAESADRLSGLPWLRA